MTRRIIDIDLATVDAPHPIGDHGVAVQVRRGDHVVGFWVPQTGASGASAGPGSDRAIRETGRAILVDAMRDEIGTTRRTQVPASLTVAVCTKDRPGRLARCLRSLTSLRDRAGHHDLAVDVLVIDNAPSDERTRRLVEQLPDVRYVVEPCPGLDFARNRAMDESSSELIAFFDDDVVVSDAWLDGLVAAYTVDPHAGAYTGQVLPYELETSAQLAFEQAGGFRHGFMRVRFDQRGPGDRTYPSGAGMFGTGANMTVRRDAARRIGGFDEALDMGASLPGGGDIDLFYRLVRAGESIVYEPRCLVRHEHRREMPALLRQFSHSWGLSVAAFIAKSHGSDPPFRPQLRRYLARRMIRQATALARGIAHGPTVREGLVAAELAGALVGLCGGYRRAVRRRDALRGAAR